MAELRIASYGAEHEWADHPLDRDPPRGFGRDVRDVTIVNSNGIANDPKGKTYGFGGEFNTPPTTDIEGQIDCMERLKAVYPEATINYRSNLHLHVRIPGLKDDLKMLKQLQAHIHKYLPQVLADVVEPIPPPSREVYKTEEEWKGAKRRFQRRRVSHQTFLTDKRLGMQAQAETLDQFFNLEPPQSAEGKPLFHLQPRVCVNLRQLLQTDTIEFRHFPGTMDQEELRTSFHWVKSYVEHALEGSDITELAREAGYWRFPQFLPYHHETEVGYRKTVHDGSLELYEIRSVVLERLSQGKSLDEARVWMIANGFAKGATQ